MPVSIPYFESASGCKTSYARCQLSSAMPLPPLCADSGRLLLQGGVMDVQRGGSGGGGGGGSFTVRLEAPANLWGAASASAVLWRAGSASTTKIGAG